MLFVKSKVTQHKMWIWLETHKVCMWHAFSWFKRSILGGYIRKVTPLF